ncbi:uncharacterized protein V1510DRAFT_402799 [Dipodascopsis tothii]|uniref:uncharacterized protein n=1 Tax=Dipodascopsis tothii TaxID=44089 RepID=UPI0034CDD604
MSFPNEHAYLMPIKLYLDATKDHDRDDCSPSEAEMTSNFKLDLPSSSGYLRALNDSFHLGMCKREEDDEPYLPSSPLRGASPWLPMLPLTAEEEHYRHNMSLVRGTKIVTDPAATDECVTEDEGERCDALLAAGGAEAAGEARERVLDALFFPDSGEFIGYLGFPTYSQCSQLIGAYLDTLSTVKKNKSLITRTMYDDIKNVLQDTSNTAIGSPQFRFWAKKNFDLFEDSDSTHKVMHKGKPVAVLEELYNILSVSHLHSNHGGRDKTLTQLRRWHSRVPKNLISQFIKICPTCNASSVSPKSHPEFQVNEDSFVRPPEPSSTESADDLGYFLNFTLKSSIVRCKMNSGVGSLVQTAAYASTAYSEIELRKLSEPSPCTFRKSRTASSNPAAVLKRRDDYGPLSAAMGRPAVAPANRAVNPRLLSLKHDGEYASKDHDKDADDLPRPPMKRRSSVVAAKPSEAALFAAQASASHRGLQLASVNRGDTKQMDKPLKNDPKPTKGVENHLGLDLPADCAVLPGAPSPTATPGASAPAFLAN